MAEDKKEEKIKVVTNVPQLHSVTLVKDHTDSGKDYKAGEVIKVDENTLTWLVQHGIVKVTGRS